MTPFSLAKLGHGPMISATLSGLFEPDIMLPGQHINARHAFTPELRLMHAILCDALYCVYRYRRHRESHVYLEAWDWLMDESHEWCTSFECICEVLELDASAVRAVVRRGTFRAARAMASRRVVEISGSRRMRRGH